MHSRRREAQGDEISIVKVIGERLYGSAIDIVMEDIVE
jgi:hypothetical protein